MARSEFSPFLGAAKWDWYRATLSADSLPDLRDYLERGWPNGSWFPARPMHGYTSGQALMAGDLRLVSVWSGGNAGTACLESSGDQSRVLADALKSWGGSYRVTRCDSALDWEEAGLFDALAASLLEFARQKGLKINQQGDWERGRARTLYVGSKSSPVFLRLYEKGFQVEGESTSHPDWVRCEVQCSPAKGRRAAAALWTPADVWGAGWVADAVERFFLIPGARLPVGVIRTAGDAARRREWLLRVGGRALREWLDDCGGDTAAFGSAVADALLDDG